MKKIFIILMISAFFLHSQTFLTENKNKASAESVMPKIYVDDDFNTTTPGWNSTHFDTIQKAIDNAANKDRIIVYEGIYFESIIIDKTIDIFGEVGASTIIDGEEEGSVVTITASNVDLSTFTIRNSGTNKTDAAVHIYSGSGNIIENTITACTCGIYVDRCDNNIIAQNDITDTVNATYLISSNENTIEYNTFYENQDYGIFLNGSCSDNIIRKNTVYSNGYYAIYLNDACRFNRVSENTVYENDDTGIRIEDDVSNTTVFDNEIYDNEKYGIFIVGADTSVYDNIVYSNGKHGIFLFADNSTSVFRNNVTNNGLAGIRMQNSTSDTITENVIYSNDQHGVYVNYYCLLNQIYNNYFSGNTMNAKDISPTANQNKWFHTNISSSNIINGPVISGNYWSDYTGRDENRDGFGDTPYNIIGEDKRDIRPLVYQKPLADAGGPYTGSVYESIIFDASGSSDVNESMNLTYYWVFEDGYFGNGETITHEFEIAGNYSVNVTVTNDHGGSDTDTTYVVISPDSIPPTIDITLHELVVTDTSTLFSLAANIEDNVAVKNVTIEYWTDNKSQIQTAVMNKKAQNLYEKTIMLSTAKSNFYCIVTATDESGNSIDTTDPFAVYSCDTQVKVSESFYFDATESFDLDGEIISYHWDFGDGITKNGVNVSYEFNADGKYPVTLTVTDDKDNTDEKTQLISVLPADVQKASNETLLVFNNKGLILTNLTEPFEGYDTDGDDKADMFVDPNGEIKLVSVQIINDKATFLLSIDDKTIPEFFWQPDSDSIEWITLKTPTISKNNVEIDYTSEEATLIITVDKADWIWIDISDTLYPDAPLKKIKDASTGRIISDDLIWRKNNHIYVLDDPSTTYELVFEDIFPVIEATFEPADSGVIDEYSQSVTISYNVPVSISSALFNGINVLNRIEPMDNKTFVFTPVGFWENGTYLFTITAEAIHGSKTSSDSATYFYFQYELPPQPSFVEKYGLVLALIGIILGGGLCYGICRFMGVTFDSYVYLKNRRLFPFFKPVIFGPMSVTVKKEKVSKAEFYVDGELKETIVDEPFVWQWNERGFLNHSVEAKVFDTNGNTLSSGKMSVFIINPFKWVASEEYNKIEKQRESINKD